MARIVGPPARYLLNRTTKRTHLIHQQYRQCLLTKGPFTFYEGRGGGGIWEAPLKNRVTAPSQLKIFFHMPPPPLIAVIFLDDPASQKKTLSQDIPLLQVIVLTLKTIFKIPILQRAVY